MENSYKSLFQVGFEVGGYWSLSNDGIQFALPKYDQTCNVLYAFASDERVLYIGKTTQSLNRRMNGYRITTTRCLDKYISTRRDNKYSRYWSQYCSRDRR
jgi:hypothetical protein